ncbi:hypothetical protein BJ875DRAFT_124624 [Amylocarpus encephaloides]|uniref:Uncharacterized protein n=1 Tax=Amylocarpus encephaloides TaxID=45428 RepID=A0A9P7YPS9_9HELO|nr:hypothetical protein BJ875DRAFT_124624 [Amylocarpus encephaloides]
MSTKIVLFVGAPGMRSLTWEEDHLLNAFSEPFVRFGALSDSSHQDLDAPSPSTSLLKNPEWRVLPLEHKHLTTGVSQDYGWQQQYQGSSFFTTSQISSYMEDTSREYSSATPQTVTKTPKEVLSQFYEQSYARHEDIPSSQLVATSEAEYFFSNSEGSASFNTSDGSFVSSVTCPSKEMPKSGPISNLKDLPAAPYLISSLPQVTTVNLIVGIISLPPPRKIKAKRGGKVELIEALVGDETRSGFGITFWLSPIQSVDAGLRKSVESLRPQDVVLMRNVALNSFQGRVYGHSLRKGLTKIHLLYRSRVDRSDVRGYYSAADLKLGNMGNPQLVKTGTVREWVLKFIGGGSAKQDLKRVQLRPESLPLDTQ